jgi:hypothetical protein
MFRQGLRAEAEGVKGLIFSEKGCPEDFHLAVPNRLFGFKERGKLIWSRDIVLSEKYP